MNILSITHYLDLNKTLSLHANYYMDAPKLWLTRQLENLTYIEQVA